MLKAQKGKKQNKNRLVLMNHLLAQRSPLKRGIPKKPEENHKNGETGTEEHIKQTTNTGRNHSAADCLPSNLKETGVTSESNHGENGNNKRNFGGKETV